MNVSKLVAILQGVQGIVINDKSQQYNVLFFDSQCSLSLSDLCALIKSATSCVIFSVKH